MTIRVDPCLRNNGTPKSAYPTREIAEQYMHRIEGWEVQNLHVYGCGLHGWHIGHKPLTKSHRRGRKGAW